MSKNKLIPLSPIECVRHCLTYELSCPDDNGDLVHMLRWCSGDHSPPLTVQDLDDSWKKAYGHKLKRSRKK